VKYYNEMKSRPFKIPDHLKNNFRSAVGVQHSLRMAMKEFRSELPLLPLSTITKASRAHIRAFFQLPNLLSPNDPRLEPSLRKNFFKTVFDPASKEYAEYLEDRLFVLDRSLEARRNYLLTEEREKVEKAIREHKEKIRIEELRDFESKRFKPEDVEVDRILDGEIDTQLVKVDSHVVLSPKGVVKMTSLPGKMPRFVDLTGQELANYICYNLLNAEQALQMFTQSEENKELDSNNKARLIQKIVILKPENAKDYRLIRLIASLDVEELSKKNVVSTIWAIGKLYQVVPKSIKTVYSSLLSVFEALIPKCNSMNLAYACEGLSSLQDLNPNITEQIITRAITILDGISLPDKPKNTEVSQINIPIAGFSFYYGSTDMTLPQTPFPSVALFKLLRFLQHAQAPIIPYIYKKSAQLINSLSLYELDKNLLIEGITVFSALSEAQLADEDIKKCVLNMSQLVLAYYEQLSIKEVCKIAEVIMTTKTFHVASWFKILELRAFEVLSQRENVGSFLQVAETFVRYYIAILYGRDVRIEPLVFIYEKFPVENLVFDKIYEYTRSQYIPGPVLNKIAKILGMVGYSINTTNDFKVESIIAASVQQHNHEGLQQIAMKDLLDSVSKSKSIEELCEFAAVLRKHKSNVNWKYFEELYLNNKDRIESQAHRIALAWAVRNKNIAYEEKLLTVTEDAMLKELRNTE
jgi:hypothetical protein